MAVACRIRVALIVLNYDGAAVIRPCLQSLGAAMGADDEIIVVDNASSDQSAELVAAEFPTARLIRRDTNNFIFGLNDGVDAAAGAQYVAFLNNDIVVEPDFVESAL